MAELSAAGWESVLRLALTAVLGVWALWWVLVLALSLIDRGLAARIAPPMLRALLVTGAIVSTATPARATTPGGLDPLHGLQLPERPVSPSVDPVRERPTRDAASYVVDPGDTLWAIAREHSPPADDAELQRNVRRWHHTNRDVIGPDPDLIRPGQRLDPRGAR